MMMVYDVVEERDMSKHSQPQKNAEKKIAIVIWIFMMPFLIFFCIGLYYGITGKEPPVFIQRLDN